MKNIFFIGGIFLLSLSIFFGFSSFAYAAEGDICTCVDALGLATGSSPCPATCAAGTVEKKCECGTTTYSDEPCKTLCPSPAAGTPGETAELVPDTGDGGGALLRAGMDAAATEAGLKPTTATEIQQVVGIVIREALKYLSILFIILILYAGIRWMTAAGDEGKIKTARGFLINASVGFIITLLAYQVTAFIINSIKIEGEAASTTAPVEAPAGAPTNPSPTP